jgi:hypothetical protein
MFLFSKERKFGTGQNKQDISPEIIRVFTFTISGDGIKV